MAIRKNKPIERETKLYVKESRKNWRQTRNQKKQENLERREKAGLIQLTIFDIDKININISKKV